MSRVVHIAAAALFAAVVAASLYGLAAPVSKDGAPHEAVALDAEAAACASALCLFTFF